IVTESVARDSSSSSTELVVACKDFMDSKPMLKCLGVYSCAPGECCHQVLCATSLAEWTTRMNGLHLVLQEGYLAKGIWVKATNAGKRLFFERCHDSPRLHTHRIDAKHLRQMCSCQRYGRRKYSVHVRLVYPNLLIGNPPEIIIVRIIP